MEKIHVELKTFVTSQINLIFQGQRKTLINTKHHEASQPAITSKVK